MKLNDLNIEILEAGVGKITKQNTTVDVKPGETERQAKKFFGGNGKPKPLGVKGATPNQAFNLGMTEGYKLQLERDREMLVLNITDTATGKRTEVRGKSGYETNNYDENDKLHQLLDKISKSANISDLMNGEVVGINPKHPDGPSAKTATTTAFNESLDNPYPFELIGPNDSQEFSALAQTPNGMLRMDFETIDYDNFGIDFSVGKSMGKTDAGDEFRVFATVVAMMTKWIKTVGIEHVESFDFGANKGEHASDGRAKLYTRFAKQLASKLGWKLEQSTTGNNDTAFFKLTNPNPVPREQEYWDALEETVNEATEMKISDLTISDAGMAIAQSAGGGSRTDAPLAVTKLPSGHVYLVNGYHRLVDAMNSGKDTVSVEYVPYEKVEILWKQEREQDIKYGKQFNEEVEVSSNKSLEEALGEISKNSEIYVDMDGVLADFFGEWSKSQGVSNWKDIEDPATAIGDIKSIDDFWLNLPVLPKAKELLGLIKQVKGKYKICTSPLADDPRSEPHKREWVKKNLAFFPPEEVIVTHNKPQFAKQKDGTPNILIDDYGVNINAWEDAGGIGFKYKDYKFNRTAKAIKRKIDQPATDKVFNENISVTGTARGKQARKKKLRPGSEEWFKHWFSLPLMKRESFEEAKKELQQHLTGLIESTIIVEELVTEETLDVSSIITPSIKKLNAVFNKNKYEIRIVGGAVRDIALGKSPKDIDMATDATPDEMIAMLDREGIKHIPTGIEHGTITAVVDGEDFEITTLRADSNTDGRRAEVEFVRSWEEDAKRRDLTYNAMSMDIDGQIYDYHNGMDDLQDKVSRFVGDPAERIQEDYLRILRYFRFQGRMENPTWDKDTVSAIADNASGLSKISVERVWMEMQKILGGKNVASILQYIKSTGVADVIGLTVDNLSNIQDDADPIIQLAKLGNPAEIARRWKMTNINAGMLEFLVTHKDQKLDKKQIEDMIADGVDKEKISALATLQGNTNMASHATSVSVPEFPVTGKDLIAKGMKPGLELGQKLAQLKTKWKQSNFKATKDDLLNEDLGTPVDWEFIVAVAIAAKMTPFAVKAMWKTAKGAYKIKKFADKVGIKLSKAAIGEDVSRNDTLARIKTQQRERYMDAMLGAMHKLVKSKGKRHGIGNYAFDIAKSFNFNPKQLEKLYREKYGVAENFADGKIKGKSRPGRVKKSGASCNGSVTELRAKAKKASGEKAKMYHWCANMKSGKQK